MQTVFFFKNMRPGEETKAQDYFWKKESAISRLLSHFPPDGVLLELKMEKFDKHSAYEAEFILKLPIGTLSAEEASHTITKAIDFAKDRLIAQIKKSSESLRRGHRSIKLRRTLKRQSAPLVA